MRRTLLSTLAVAVLLGMAVPAVAQEAKPLLTIAFSGYDELKADINFIGSLADNPGLADGLEALLTLMTQGQGLAGLDKTKPWGAVVQSDADEFPVFGFVPVTDMKQFIETLKKFSLLINEEEGVYKVVGRTFGPGEEPGNTVVPMLVLKEKNGWAFIAQLAEGLDDLPADPIATLGGLHEKYDLAVRASVRDVPEPMRQMFIAQLQMGVQAGMEQMPGEGDDEYAIRTGVTKKMIDQFITMVNELDAILVGWAIDHDAGTSYLDVEITAIEGSSLAGQFAQLKAGKTNYAGFNLEGAALTGNWTGTLSDADVAQAKASIANVRTTAISALKEEGLSQEELDLATGVLKDLLDVVDRTVDNRQLDGGVVAMVGSDEATIAMGGLIVNGDDLELVIKRVAQLAQQDNPDLAQAIKLDVGAHQGVRFHSLTVSLPEPRDEIAAKLFGEQVTVVLGISDDSVYVAAGSKPEDLLKQVIDKSKAEPGKAIPPFTLSLAATPIAKAIGALAPEEQAKAIAAQIVAALEETPGKDHVTITSTPIPNGSRTRLEIEQGILKMLPMMAPVPGGGPPGEGPPAEAGDNPF